MSSRPLTPPCVPFGTRRFNRISALARTVSGYCSIQHGRVFPLRDLPVQSALQHIANMPFAFSPLSMPFLSALPALSSSLLWSLVSSIVSRYTSGTYGLATCPTLASSSSCSLSQSSPAISGCRPLRSPSFFGISALTAGSQFFQFGLGFLEGLCVYSNVDSILSLP